jgi:hypothetical protein
MTVGQLVETLFGKACCMYGAYGDCTAFSTKGSNYDTYGEMLTKVGYHHSGNQILYNGFTGQQLYSEIFIGPTYYMRLKHMVKDKINYRATGKRNFLTRQTNQGRANDGGLKIGEMERDGIMAHGLSYFLNESYMVRGDQYYMAVCNKTGAIAVYNPDKNLFLSPFADGPLVFNRNVEGQEILDAISKFGRSFSLLRIPYALKLLIQELQVMNIQMRIITEDNIDQLTNLSFQSRNIDKLLHIEPGAFAERDIKEIIENYTHELDLKIIKLFNEKKEVKKNREEPQSFQPEQTELGPITPSMSPPPEQTEFGPRTPSMSPPSDLIPTAPGSPAYNPESPLYNPDLNTDSPPFNPFSSQGGGTINLFSDPNMNASFNMLNGSSQAEILQMEPEQREIVMREIIRKSGRQETQNYNEVKNQSENSSKGLEPYFNALPVDKQISALKGGYQSMSSEFSKLEGKMEEPLITIKKPISTHEELTNKFPILSIDQKGGDLKNDTTSGESSLSDNSSSSSSSSKEESISNSTTKTITF